MIDAHGLRNAKLTLAACVFAVLVCAALVCAANAGAAPVRISNAALGDTEFGPAVSGDFVYWTQLKRHKNRLLPSITTVFQRRISTGETRTIFAARNTIVDRLMTDGSRVAFSATTVRTLNRHIRKNHDMTSIFVMNASDPAPTSVVNSTNPTKLTIRLDHVHGHRRTTSTYSDCGMFPELLDVSEIGQVFVNEESVPCSKRQKTVSRSLIFNVGSATPVVHRALGIRFFANIQFGKIVAEDFLNVKSTDLATGLKTSYQIHGLPWQAEFNAAGDFAVVADVEIRRTGRFQSQVAIYPAGSTTPKVRILESELGQPSVVWCAGGLVELSEPGRHAMKLVMRALDGSVIKQLAGPRSGLGYDAKCAGNHLTLAAKADDGQPQIFQYDF